MSLWFVLLLGFAVSLDGLFAGLAYGMRQVRISTAPMLIIGMINALCTAAAMLCALLLGQEIDTRLAIASGSILLIALGLSNLWKELRPHDAKTEPSVGNNKSADASFSYLNCSEAVILGLALGIDNMVATFAATLLELLPLYTPVIMAVMQAAFIAVGIYAAERITPTLLQKRVPYLPGAILILLGLLRLR